jgi:hypothetical protein
MRRAVSGCSHFEENGTTFDRDLPYQQPLKERLLAAKKHPDTPDHFHVVAVVATI